MNRSIKQYLQVFLGPVLAAIFGLIAMLLVGLAFWPLARGLSGIAIGSTVSVLVAMLLRLKADWPTSMIASGLGAMIACYFAIATAELLPPGSLQWIWKGGLYGAAFGIPVATILSPLGLRGTRRSSG